MNHLCNKMEQIFIDNNGKQVSMRKIIVSEFITLDGVIESPEKWQFPYLSKDLTEEIQAGVHLSEASIYGRETYEIFAASWPQRTENEFGVADKLNSELKYVVSTSLEKADWNNSIIIERDAEEEIRTLKQQLGGTIRIVGSAMLVRSLMMAGLIDEIHLMVHPLVVGHGKRLFNEDINTTGLKLVGTKSFSSGVVLLQYQSGNDIN